MWTYFPMPTPHSGPCLTTAGIDGAQWIEENFANRIARIDLDNGEILEWPVPRFYGGESGGDAGAERPVDLNGTPEGVPHFTCAMMNGDDGFMYFSNGTPNQIVRIDPWTKKMDVYNAPDWWGNLEPYNDLTLGKDHAVWSTQSTNNKIGRFDEYTHEWTDINIPTPGSLPIGMHQGPDNAVYFTEGATNKIGRVDLATHEITDYPIPAPHCAPFVIRANTEGKYIWWGNNQCGSIGRMDVFTKEITLYQIPTPHAMPGITCENHGKIYFDEYRENKFGSFNPKTGQFREISIPNRIGVPIELRCGWGNALWTPDYPANRVVRLNLDSDPI
jgi:streptogramin lyase